MASVTEMRAWLLEQGEDVPARGRLRPDLIARYNAAHDDGEIITSGDDWEIADPEDLEPSVPMTPERPPRTQRAQRAERRAQPVTARASTLVGKLLGEDKKKTAAKKGKTPPRTSLEKFISNRYSDFGKLLVNLSVPMSRCVQSQAAFAGVVWEDILRGTIVDRGLQPLARAEDKLDKGFALVGTPLAVLAVEQNQLALATERISPQQFAVRQMFTMSMLRAGLRKQLEIGRAYADQIREKIEGDLVLDAEVDALIEMIFAPPQGTVEPEPEMAGAAA